MPYYSPYDGLDDTPQANYLIIRCMASGDKIGLTYSGERPAMYGKDAG